MIARPWPIGFWPASIDLDEEEAERLWAAEAQRRLKEYRAGGAVRVDAQDVVKKVEKLFR